MSEFKSLPEIEQEQRSREMARNSLLVGGLPEEAMEKVEERLGDVDWRALAAAQDSLFMATNSTLGIRRFWATTEESGRTLLETMETTDMPDQLAGRMYTYAFNIERMRVL
jgi:hypothetical protein